MSILAAPMFAVAFGAFLLCAETCLHFQTIMNPSHWTDLPVHDWLAGGLLVYGGVLARREWSTNRVYQVAGWAFMSSLLVAAFVAHWEEWARQPQHNEWISQGGFIGILAVLMALAFGALVSTLKVHTGR
jgi:hypothetical protein